MLEVPLSRGKVALIDDEDFSLVATYKWQANCKKGQWYAQTVVGPRENRMTLQMARVIMGLQKGDKRHVDHINHCTLDNRKENLRVCAPENNHQNLVSRSGRSSFKGVYPHSSGKGWVAQIQSLGQMFYLGYFRSEAVAALAYDFAAMRHHREFACFNF